MNGKVFLSPRNEERKFLSLVAGWDQYGGNPWAALNGARADAQAIYAKLVETGYEPKLLLNASSREFDAALEGLLEEASRGCIRPSLPRGGAARDRGLRLVPLEPCKDVVLFVYLAGHGFVYNGTNYIVPSDAGKPEDELAATRGSLINVEKLRARMAREVAVQVIIADVSRSNYDPAPIVTSR